MVEDTSGKELLASDEPTSQATSLGYRISIFVDPETRKIQAVISDGPFGSSEYDPEAKLWAAMSVDQTWRLRDMENNSVVYMVNWKNDADFDENGDCITVQKYADGTLDEEYLKQNTIAIPAPVEE